MFRPGPVLVFVVALAAAGFYSGPADGQAQRDERRGLVLDGLQRRPGGPCGEALEVVTRPASARSRCTHGPDPAPAGVDVRLRRTFPDPDPDSANAPGRPAASSGLACVGNGTDGYRVQLLYARLSGTTNRLASLYSNFVEWAGRADMVFNTSASKTGGVRHLRVVADGSCNAVITAVEVPVAALNDFGAFTRELTAQGFTRSDRKYLVWADANVYCGIAELYVDDSPGATPGLISSNASNGNSLVAGAIARVDNGCWGLADSVEAHELVHTMGGVQASAPNATRGGHCTDDADRLCYLDGTPRHAVPSLHRSRRREPARLQQRRLLPHRPARRQLPGHALERGQQRLPVENRTAGPDHRRAGRRPGHGDRDGPDRGDRRDLGGHDRRSADRRASVQHPSVTLKDVSRRWPGTAG